jgi:hypothetical protein
MQPNKKSNAGTKERPKISPRIFVSLPPALYDRVCAEIEQYKSAGIKKSASAYVAEIVRDHFISGGDDGAVSIVVGAKGRGRKRART